MIRFNEKYGLVNATSAANGTVAVPVPTRTYRQIFLVTITVTGDVWLEAAVTPTNGGTARWVPVSGKATATDSIFLEGPFSNLRVAWSGNTGLISVDQIITGFNPNLY